MNVLYLISSLYHELAALKFIWSEVESFNHVRLILKNYNVYRNITSMDDDIISKVIQKSKSTFEFIWMCNVDELFIRWKS